MKLKNNVYLKIKKHSFEKSFNTEKPLLNHEKLDSGWGNNINENLKLRKRTTFNGVLSDNEQYENFKQEQKQKEKSFREFLKPKEKNFKARTLIEVLNT